MKWTDWWEIGTWLAMFFVFIGALIVGGSK